MGYPMTFRRLVARNGLQDGGYGKPPGDWSNFTTELVSASFDKPLCGMKDTEALEEAYRSLWKFKNEERKQLHSKISALAGDLRRLERDSIDEQAIVDYIIHRLGYEINRDDIAAIIRFFFEF
jgi:hypothetical protein